MAAKGRYLTAGQLKRRLSRLLSPFWASSRRTYAGFSDEQFYAPTEAEVRTFLEAEPIPAELYQDEVFDCDDYAFVLKGLVSLHARSLERITSSMSIGIAWGRFDWVDDEFHATNWVLLEDGEFRWLEPQDGTVHAVGECSGGLTLVVV